MQLVLVSFFLVRCSAAPTTGKAWGLQECWTPDYPVEQVKQPDRKQGQVGDQSLPEGTREIYLASCRKTVQPLKSKLSAVPVVISVWSTCNAAYDTESLKVNDRTVISVGRWAGFDTKEPNSWWRWSPLDFGRFLSQRQWKGGDGSCTSEWRIWGLFPVTATLTWDHINDNVTCIW